MKVICAPDKFKGCPDAVSVARAMAEGVRRVVPDAEVIELPLSDGGDGFVDTIVRARGGEVVRLNVTGPLPEIRVDAPVGLLPDGQTAVIEVAAASGLALVPPELRNPLATTSFGTGELMAHAARLGRTKLLIGLGGSATCDGGIGLAQACGFQIVTTDGEALSLTEPLCGRDLPRVLMIKHGRGGATDRCTIAAATDVTNPLLGPNGAAAVFGPQKGASIDDVRWLDAELTNLVRRHHAEPLAASSRTGAAGGIGFGLAAFFNATLESGARLAIDACGLEQALRGATLCLTGEGRIDASSADGKLCGEVARLARSLGVPCVALAGDVRDSTALDAIACSIVDRPMSEAEAMRDVYHLVADAAERAVRLVRVTNR